MAIELTYGDDADCIDIDYAILEALGRKAGYVVQVTYRDGLHPAEDVVVERWDDDKQRLFVRKFDEPTASAVGEEFYILDVAIDSIKIY